MNWLKKLFSGSARRAQNPAVPAPGSTVVPDIEAKRISGESVRTYITRMESEAARTGNAPLARHARRLRAVHCR